MKLILKNSNLCDHNPPTLQTDRQTTCDRNTTLCTKVHRAVKTEFQQLSYQATQRMVTAEKPVSVIVKIDGIITALKFNNCLVHIGLINYLQLCVYVAEWYLVEL